MNRIKMALIALIVAFFAACEKEPDFSKAGKDVEFYLIKSYETKAGTSEIINSSIKLQEKALITYNQILSYNPGEHKFELAQSAIDTINQEGGLMCHFKAFAITVDKEIIYTGYFWPSYASSIKQWFAIDPILISENNGLKVQMAYPTNSFAGKYDDVRNDPRIINVFRRDGKIKE